MWGRNLPAQPNSAEPIGLRPQPMGPCRWMLRGAAATSHCQAGPADWMCNRDSLPWISFSYFPSTLRALAVHELIGVIESPAGTVASDSESRVGSPEARLAELGVRIVFIGSVRSRLLCDCLGSSG